jgi:hypothetical protein
MTAVVDRVSLSSVFAYVVHSALYSRPNHVSHIKSLSFI